MIGVSFLLNEALGLGCLNAKGKEVPWWQTLKFPPRVQEGYAYIDSTTEQQNFSFSYSRIDVSGTHLYATLQQINTVSGLEVLAWNDENQDKNSSSAAHSKGVLAYSQKLGKGFYLVHSLPKYPSWDKSKKKVNITIDSSEEVHGQNLMCMSLSISQINHIASIVKYAKLNVYVNSIKNASSTSDIYEMGQANLKTNDTILNTTISVGGKTITVIAKTKNNCSIWEDGIAEIMNEGFYAETWGTPLEASYCPKGGHHVRNIKSLTLGGVSWPESNDHSKWGIADYTKRKSVCFGDMNRMTSQFKRGGSFFCMVSDNIWNQLKQAITLIEDCK